MLEEKKKEFVAWIQKLQNDICNEFEKIEDEFVSNSDSYMNVYKDGAPRFVQKIWNREDSLDADGGYGKTRLLRGNVFEKVGVNISEVYGTLSEEFAKEIPGSLENGNKFWASGISVVSHMKSPLIPAIHMNTRMICTAKSWFGGGIDITPYSNDNIEEYENYFHTSLKDVCDQYNKDVYKDFRNNCDNYFYLKHRLKTRGIGGIFYDNLHSSNLDEEIVFSQNVGKVFLEIYKNIVRKHMYGNWTEEQKNIQLRKRGEYVEFNLLYDRGTKFGLQTGGNIEAIFMSLPPHVEW